MARNNCWKKRSKKGGNNNNSNRNKGRSNPKPKETSKRKRLDDHMCYVGSAKQASDFVTIANFLVNCVRTEHKKGEDIANSLDNLEEPDFDKDAPVVGSSSAADAALKNVRTNSTRKHSRLIAPLTELAWINASTTRPRRQLCCGANAPTL